MREFKQFILVVQQHVMGSPHAARNATRLWNWADHQAQPEPFWTLLKDACPELFGEGLTIRFAY